MLAIQRDMANEVNEEWLVDRYVRCSDPLPACRPTAALLQGFASLALQQ